MTERHAMMCKGAILASAVLCAGSVILSLNSGIYLHDMNGGQLRTLPESTLNAISAGVYAILFMTVCPMLLAVAISSAATALCLAYLRKQALILLPNHSGTQSGDSESGEASEKEVG